MFREKSIACYYQRDCGVEKSTLSLLTYDCAILQVTEMYLVSMRIYTLPMSTGKSRCPILSYTIY